MIAMGDRPEIIPLLLLKGRMTLIREYSRKSLSTLSKTFRERNYEKVYVMDLDGIERNRPQLDIVQYLSDDFSVLYEAGPRRGVNVIDLVVAGADTVYMNTYSLKSLGEVELALALTERVGFKIDWDRHVLGSGEGIEGESLENILSGAMRMGAGDFAIPAEILDRSLGVLKNDRFIVRALCDRPGDENLSNEKVASVIIDQELLLGAGAP